MNQSINDGGVCRTAPATPGLLKIQGLSIYKLVKKKGMIALWSHFEATKEIYWRAPSFGQKYLLLTEI